MKQPAAQQARAMPSLLNLLKRQLFHADLKPGSFRLELLGPPDGGDVDTLPAAAAAPTPSTSASSGGPAPAAAAFAPSPGLATGFGHFSLVVPSTATVLDALRAAGRADLILEECAAVIPVRSHGQSWTVSSPAGQTLPALWCG